MHDDSKIHFRCSHCDKNVSVAQQYGGKRGKCPGCGKIIRIPATNPVRVPPNKPLRADRGPEIRQLSEQLFNNNATEPAREEAARKLAATGDSQAVTPLVQALADGKFPPSVRAAAADALGKLPDERAVASLQTILDTYPKECLDVGGSIAIAAMNSLALLRGAHAIPTMIQLLQNPVLEVRQGAATRLRSLHWEPGDLLQQALIEFAATPTDQTVKRQGGDYASLQLRSNTSFVRGNPQIDKWLAGDTAPLQPLVAALQSDSIVVRKTAIRALAQLRDARAVDPLIAVLRTDSVGDVVADAAEALAEIGDIRAAEHLFAAFLPRRDVRYRITRSLVKLKHDPTIATMITMLVIELNDWNLRSDAALRLEDIGDPHAQLPLIAALGDVPRVIPTREVVQALAKCGNADAVPALIAVVVADSSDYHRLAGVALSGLVRIGLPSVEPLLNIVDQGLAVTLLARGFKDPDPIPVMPTIIALALGSIGGPRALERLLAELARDGPPKWIAKAYVEGIVRMGDPGVDALMTVLNEPQHPGRQYVADALGKLRGKSMGP